MTDDADTQLSAHDLAIRRFFVPDAGCMMADIDLSKADLHVVVWEAGDDVLKQQLREGVNVYSEAGKVVQMHDYDMCKRFIHLTNYGGNARTLASSCGLTTKAAETAQRRWFGAHPGIRAWHDRTRQALQRQPAVVRNRLGYHRIFFGRNDDAQWREALNWVPQSTVACVTNRALVRVAEQVSWATVLLQVHDSLLVQFPRERFVQRTALRDAMQVVVPYDDPLVIPAGIKVSEASWGDCVKVTWED